MSTENREQIPPMERISEDASRNTLALNPLVGIRGQDLVESAGILFKGSGFYETDYRSESYKAGQKKEEEASKPAAETKSDAKPEANGTAPAANGESKPSGGGKKGKAGSTGKGAEGVVLARQPTGATAARR